MSYTRRTFLSTAAGVAGLGTIAGCMGGASEESEAIAQASFFVFGDVAAEVTGETAASELLVPIGQHGHGWEPGPRVREDIRETELFVHGMPGFQPWVDSIRGDLEADGANVATVDASADVELLEAGHGEHEEDDHHDEEHSEEGEHEEGEQDHGARDPHFWMDPLRVADAADTVGAALADVDGENAAAYADNADSYRGQLEELDARIESLVAEATTATLLVAGHDSFSYLGDRYGIEVRALTDVSPDDRPTARDIERAQDVIADHGLQYICADPLESQQAAEQLVAETDAEAVLPLTAMPGLTEEWEENGWGYVEVMENVNHPTLERAL